MRKIKALLASRMEVIGDVLDSDELWLAAKGTDADMVIVMLLDANGDPHVCTQMLKAYSHSRIVAQLTTDEAVYLHESSVDKTRINERFERPVPG